MHDVQWSPKGDYFLTVAGFMPAKVTLFTDKCVPKYDLGRCAQLASTGSCSCDTVNVPLGLHRCTLDPGRGGL